MRLSNNPFCASFPEYQVYCVRALQALTMLDDIPINNETKVEVNAQRLYAMDRFDEIFEQRVL